MAIGLIILMASTVSVLVSNMDEAPSKPKPGYPWPQPKPADTFAALNDFKVPPNDADKPMENEAGDKGDGADDKKGGVVDGTRVEQYPDKPIKMEDVKETQSSMQSEYTTFNKPCS